MSSFDEKSWSLAGGPPAEVQVTAKVAHRFDGEDDVRSWLAAQAGDGWVCCTSEVKRWSSGGPLPRGVPLRAEVTVPGKRASLALRRTGEEWVVTETMEIPGVAHRAFDINLLSTEKGLRLMYRQYWHEEEEGPPGAAVNVWRPFAARFLGWEER
jgi:hypothetical protein